jgi:hypothetical protein
VLTRLHARYTKDTLNEDLIFEAAGPIEGGRGTPDNTGALARTGASPSSGPSQFQGRYVILHPWTGPISCQEPVRGRWGGPPNGPRAAAKAARDLANAPRGNVQLPALVREDVPEIKLKTRNAFVPLQSRKKLTTPPGQPGEKYGSGPVDSAGSAPSSSAGSGCGCRISAGAVMPWFLPWRR